MLKSPLTSVLNPLVKKKTVMKRIVESQSLNLLLMLYKFRVVNQTIILSRAQFF